MQLVVEELSNDATTLALTKDAITVAARSRLRAARLYSEDTAATAWSYLYVNVNVFGSAHGIGVDYNKDVRDIATMLEFQATTWRVGGMGTHGPNPNFILLSVARHTDEFIDEYLRVNADACK